MLIADSTINAALNEWFSRTASNPRRWSATEIGRTIKRNLQAAGNWKYQPRGNPAKGRAVATGAIE